MDGKGFGWTNLRQISQIPKTWIEATAWGNLLHHHLGANKTRLWRVAVICPKEWLIWTHQRSFAASACGFSKNLFVIAGSLHPQEAVKKQLLTVDQVQGNQGMKVFFLVEDWTFTCCPGASKKRTLIDNSSRFNFELELSYLLFKISRSSWYFLIMLTKTFKYLSWIVPQQINYQHLW